MSHIVLFLSFHVYSRTDSATDVGLKLKTIPPTIHDLTKITILSKFAPPPPPAEGNPHKAPFNARRLERIQTAPASAFVQGGSRGLARQGSETLAQSSAAARAPPPPPPRHEIHLFLSSNVISVLPPELFEVKNLTVLTLRQSASLRQSYPHTLTHLLQAGTTSPTSRPRSPSSPTSAS